MRIMTINRRCNRLNLILGLILTFCVPIVAFGAEPGAEESEAAQLTEQEPSRLSSPPTVGVGLLAGTHLDPLNAAFATYADFYIGRYLSLGPNIQVGFNDARGFFTATFGGKFHIPIAWYDEDKLVEFTAQSAVGYFFHRVSGVNSDNFIFEAGPGLNVMLTYNWALEAIFLFNVTNENTERLFTSALAGVKYLF